MSLVAACRLRPVHGGYPDAESVLEDCPFCDGEFPIMPTRDHTGHVVICTSCSALGPTRRTREEAIAAWNTRPDRSRP